jgi:hypothetical protein
MLLLFLAGLTDIPVMLSCAISSKADYNTRTVKILPVQGSVTFTYPMLSLEGQARLNSALALILHFLRQPFTSFTLRHAI